LSAFFADVGYQEDRRRHRHRQDRRTWKLEIVKRNAPLRRPAQRWIVERTLAWISHNRRLARDFERYALSVAAFVRLAMIRIMLQRLSRPLP